MTANSDVRRELAVSEEWTCFACGEALVLREVPLSYQGATFRVEVPCCPTCGQYFLPESVVLGKMAEVEQALEDK